MTIHNCKDDKHWYVHINHYHGLDDVHAIFRGDSNPQLEYKGKRYNLFEIEDSLYYDYEELKQDYKDEYGVETEWSFDDYVDDCPETLYMLLALEERKHLIELNKQPRTKKNKQPMTTKELTTTEREVMELATTLEDRTAMVEWMQDACVIADWDAHHFQRVTLSEAVGDWQVLRVYDVEIDWCDPYDKATDEEKEAINKESEESGYYDNAWEKLLERLEKDNENPYNDFFVGEACQHWMNMKTGEVVFLGKVYDENPRCWDEDKTEWEVLDTEATGGRDHTFVANWYGEFGVGFYRDISVHELLTKHGYKPIDALNWWQGCSGEEEENRSMESRFFKCIDGQAGWMTFLMNVAQGGLWERRLKMFPMEAIVAGATVNALYTDEFYDAMKIVQRRHYEIPVHKMAIWKDMFEALCQLGKDIKNPAFICPDNLNEAHDRYISMLEHNKDKAERKAYEKKIAPYKDIMLSNGKYDIYVCPSIKEMLREGMTMRNCVHAMRYYSKQDTLVLLCRNKEGGSEATIELNTKSWSIRQCYAAGNRVHSEDLIIRNLVMHNIGQFKDAKNTIIQPIRQAA